MAAIMDSIPMPTSSAPVRSLKSFKVISFDVYGTLIDFKPAILSALRPLLSRVPEDSPYKMDQDGEDIGAQLLVMFKSQEDALMVGKPVRPFQDVLREIYLRIASELHISPSSPGLAEEAIGFGGSVGSLPAYADSVEACQRLSAVGYKLVFLSNIEKHASSLTSEGPLRDVSFWREYSASDFEQDDPDRRKLEFLVKQVTENEQGGDIRKDEILHVANSLGHDHAPAKKVGLSTVWIWRDSVRWGKEQEIRASIDKVGYGWRFGSLNEFADAVEAEWKLN